MPPATRPGPQLEDSAFIRACRRQPVPHVPVWFMRQAGRSLPEYRAARGEGSILDAIAQPELVAELTLQPVRRYGTDAAILFSDIAVPVAAVGFGMDVAAGTGPVVEQPFESKKDLQRLRPLEPEVDIPHVIEGVRLAVAELGNVPLIGFVGGPFTMASYLVEGGPSKNFTKVKTFMHAEPALWESLTERLADIAIASLRAQVAAGASAVQVFDSWIGVLSPRDYTQLVLPVTRRIFDEIAPLGVPGILFGVGTGDLLIHMATSGADVIGVDWRVPLDEARYRVGYEHSVQGNLDPALCLAPWPAVRDAARDIMEKADTVPGHIFNLGHGVLPETDPGVLAELVGLVHDEGQSGVHL